MIPFPPIDCRGLDVQCGDFVQITVGTKLMTLQVVAVFQRDGKWALTGLTPTGEHATIEGVEHCKVVLMPPGIQFSEGVSSVDT